MKSTLKSASTALRRLFWLYQIRSLEITIHGQSECLDLVVDRLLEARIIAAQHNARIIAIYNFEFISNPLILYVYFTRINHVL